MEYKVREANILDIPYLTNIYNQGIEDRIATLETRLRENSEMEEWFTSRGERYKVIVIEDNKGIVIGWASINVFNSRCCYNGVGDISIYINRNMRGKGLGNILLNSLFNIAKQQDFHKLVLSTFEFNDVGKRLYKRLGFREVGTYINQGILDGKFVNITIMEKLL
ncbi:arsinothricin resistance N-acetyltransferase ArsN1 family A [Tissierella sp. Yu-01]|uniref:arsinothricin resistance N-acetyltransferase ArsN1 family A n=1 Tax=Tissierella sp. Yu-01 TaxID=3035694 RepID=UPI00240D8B34|nr:arsinothricin resistance N-acetyltransferase ArsN1 family A [Tissierella sp. Yu-01]WFA08374.1 arsinothricin resistance N-acetyltransferase ArsN1 [Tissierella sp. Yu-01]